MLEDRSQHSLNNDTWAGVRDERRLLVQLLSEEIDTQVAVLASGGRGRDADDLARTALENQEIAETDVVSWNGDGVGAVRLGGGIGRSWAGAASYDDVNIFASMLRGPMLGTSVLGLVVVTAKNMIGSMVNVTLHMVRCLVKTMADAVMLTWPCLGWEGAKNTRESHTIFIIVTHFV